MFKDRGEVGGGALGRGVGALAGDRVVGDDDVGDAQHQAAGGQPADGVADGRGVAAGQGAAGVGQFDLGGARVLPGQELLHQFQGQGEVLGRVLDVRERVERAAGYALPEQDVGAAGRGERRHDEHLADAGDQVAADRLGVRVLRARAQAVHVGDGEGALRGAVRGALGVAGEHLHQLALAGGDEHQVVGAGEVVEVADGGAVDDELSAALGEGLHPAGHLDPLVHRLRVPVEVSQPVDRALRGTRVEGAGGGDRHAETLDLRGLGLPEVQLEVTLVLEGGVEHALRGHDPSGADLVRGPVGHEGDLVPVRLEAQGELETGLAGPDDEYLPHTGDAPKGATRGFRRARGPRGTRGSR
ncbi:hypothetical protein SALBM217S_10760 [Streptomyces griseoloalbus]